MLLGYIRDTSSHSVLSALGVYDSADSSRDATRVVVWQPDASRVELIEYDGESARLDTVPTVPTLSVALAGVMKFNALLEFLQSHIDGTATPPPPSGSNQRQKPVEAPEPASPPTPSADEPKVAPTATGETAAERRARLQAKMDEQERRDQARREKLAAKATEAAHTRAPIEVEAESEAVDDDVIVDVTDQEEEGKIDVEATPAEAPSPSPEEGVQDELLEGQSPADELPLEPEEPVPAEAPSQEGVQPEQTVVHEEL
jgi:protein disulfide-isomerase A6